MQTLVQDKGWEKVKRALSNPKWDFRTLDAMVVETGLSREEIERLLSEHKDEVRKANVTDKKGRLLYTLASKPVGFREIIANTRAFIAKTTY